MSDWLQYAERGRAIKWPYPIRYDVENEVSTDVLVVGGGIAGCFAAITAAKKGLKVALLEKGATIRSGSAGSGIDNFSVITPLSKLSPEELIANSVAATDGYTNAIIYYIAAREGYDTLLELEKMGGKVRDSEGIFKGAPFRDEKTGFCFCGDVEAKTTLQVWGATFKPALYKECKRLGVAIYDRTQATSLLTERGKQGARVVGATGLNIRTGEFTVFKAKATILCLSCPQRIWQFSAELAGLNTGKPHTNIGNGHAMAWRAGAALAHMERSGSSIRSGVGYPFPANSTATHPSWGACPLVDATGKPVTFHGGTRSTPDMEADLVGRIMKGEYKLPLYGDLPSLPEVVRKALFGPMGRVGHEGKSEIPVVATYTQAGFDPSKDMLQSYIMLGGEMAGGGRIGRAGISNMRTFGEESPVGGVLIDWDMKTNLEGLYAAGDQLFLAVAAHAASATGRYAGRKAAEFAIKAAEPRVNRKQIEAEKARVYAPIKRKDGIDWKELNNALCRVMQNYCGDLKSDELLNIGLLWLKDLEENEAPRASAWDPHKLGRTIDVLDLITCSQIIIHACLARKASSKFLNFQRLDYPEVDPPEWLKCIALRLEDSKVKSELMPIDFWGPLAENYEAHNKDYQGWYRSKR